jgi:hypothetical protein
MSSPHPAPSTLLSSCHVVGMFSLSRGSRVHIPETLSITPHGPLGVNTAAWYAYYDTFVKCVDGIGPRTIVRFPSPPTHVVRHSSSLALILGEFLGPSHNRSAFIDASRILFLPCFTSTPYNDNYHSSIDKTFFFTVGTVSGPEIVFPDCSRSFPVRVTHHIRDAERRFTVLYDFLFPLNFLFLMHRTVVSSLLMTIDGLI